MDSCQLPAQKFTRLKVIMQRAPFSLLCGSRKRSQRTSIVFELPPTGDVSLGSGCFDQPAADYHVIACNQLRSTILRSQYLRRLLLVVFVYLTASFVYMTAHVYLNKCVCRDTWKHSLCRHVSADLFYDKLAKAIVWLWLRNRFWSLRLVFTAWYLLLYPS